MSKSKTKAKSTKKPKTRQNPVLIKVNPGDEKDSLWKKAKELKPDLKKKEFEKGLKQHFQQHGSLPAKMEIADIPGVDGVFVEVGGVNNIEYVPNPKSRKQKGGPYRYVHKTKDEKLYVDTTGKSKILHGKTTMKKDGWLHD